MEENKWMFKIELKDDKVFDKYEKQFGIIIPEELRQFIVENNAANPSHNLVVINGSERVVDVALSFNEKEDDAVTFSQMFGILNNNNDVPFAMDPFGNVFCYNNTTGKIEFYNHEEDIYEKTKMGFTDFINSLYA